MPDIHNPFWMHLSKDAQELRLSSLENDPLTAARVSQRDWEHWKLYDLFIDSAEQVITRTNRGKAQWTIVEGVDSNYRGLTVATILRDALIRQIEMVNSSQSKKHPVRDSNDSKSENKLKSLTKEIPGNDKASPQSSDQTESKITVLDNLDMNRRVSKKIYRTELRELQARLYHLHLNARLKGVSSILVFEGPDAAGKGGIIRRVTNALQPRNYQVYG